MKHSGNDADASVFGAFHRQRRRESLRRRGPITAVLTLALAAGVWGVVTHPPAASPASAAVQDAVLTGQPAVQPGAGSSDAAATNTSLAAGPANAPAASDGSASPAADPSAAAPSDPASLPQTGTPAVRPQQNFSIAVATRGFQAELDQCQWVRMDVGAVAPIVGAHNFCHGDIVLAMEPGDIVSISGTELDGDYQVTGSRDAHAGDNAAEATAGLTADLILQTCYWGDNGLRLVTLRQVDLSLPPVVVDHY